MKSTILIALLLGGSGIALISEQSIPGDFLYPVKLHVNENIKHAAAIGSVAEAKLALRLLQERLREVEVLAEKGELDTQTTANVREAISAQASIVAKTSGIVPGDSGQALRQDLQNSLEGFRLALVAYQATLSTATIESLTMMADEVAAPLGETATPKEDTAPAADIDSIAAAIADLEAQQQLLSLQVVTKDDQVRYDTLALVLVKAKSAFASGEYAQAAKYIEETKTLLSTITINPPPVNEEETPVPETQEVTVEEEVLPTADEAGL